MTLLHKLFGGSSTGPTAPESMRQPTASADVGLLDRAEIEEYRTVANEVGVSAQLLDIEEFRLFLDYHDLPIFNRHEVIRYMDDITDRTNPTG